MIVEAISRGDAADYVNAVFGIYAIMIIARILLSWLPQVPHVSTLRPVLDFITESTDPYLNVFRKVINPVGPSEFKLDLSPILALLVLGIVDALIVNAIINP
jgi:YggT family protein